MPRMTKVVVPLGRATLLLLMVTRAFTAHLGFDVRLHLGTKVCLCESGEAVTPATHTQPPRLLLGCRVSMRSNPPFRQRPQFTAPPTQWALSRCTCI